MVKKCSCFIHGEQKVARELNTSILGQNSKFDMKVIIEGVEYECDVKKLDNYTFNTGVNGRNALRPIKTKITDLLNIFKKIIGSNLLTIEEIALLQDFKKVSPDELCVSNIRKLNKILYMLYAKRRHLISMLPSVQPFVNKDGSIIGLYNSCHK